MAMRGSPPRRRGLTIAEAIVRNALSGGNAVVARNTLARLEGSLRAPIHTSRYSTLTDWVALLESLMQRAAASGGTGPGWNPSKPLPSSGARTILDWNPAVGVTVVSGFITTVLDQSGHGNTGGKNPGLIMGTGPTLIASDALFQNKPSFGFDQSGQAQTLIAASFSGISGSFCVFIRAKDLATVGLDAGGSLFGAKGIASGSPTSQIIESIASQSAGGGTDAFVKVSQTIGSSSYSIAADWALTGAVATYMHQCDGTNAGNTVKLNGVTQAKTPITSNDPGTGQPGAQSFAIAADPTGSPRRTMHVARVLIFPQALPAADITTVQTYLTANY